MKIIYEKLKTDFEHITSKRFTGYIKVIAIVLATRISEILSKLEYVMKQAFISTADKDYLFFHTGEFLPPKTAKAAKGEIVVFGESESVIPAGTVFSDGENDYETIESGQIKLKSYRLNVSSVDDVKVVTNRPSGFVSCNGIINNEKVFARVNEELLEIEMVDLPPSTTDRLTIVVKRSEPIETKAKDIGEQSNQTFDSILSIKKNIEGIDKDARVSYLSGGSEDENVEDYRLRVRKFLSSPQAPFSKNHIKHELLSNLSQLKYVWVKGGEVEAGKVQIIAVNNSFDLSEKNIEDIKRVVNFIRPVTLKKDDITVIKPKIGYVSISVINLSPSHDYMKIAIEKNIKSFFNDDFYEKAITRQDIESVIYRTFTATEKVKSFDLGVDYEVFNRGEPNTFYKLRKVNFESSES